MAKDKKVQVQDPVFQIGQEVWALFKSKFALKKVSGVCFRETEKDWIYFFEGQIFGKDAWFLENQLFDSKEALIMSLDS